MANHKRKRARIRQGNHWSETATRARMGMKPVRITREVWRALDVYSEEWRNMWRCADGHHYRLVRTRVRWHDIMFNTRPKRRLTKKLLQQALRDWKDPDDVTWPLGNHKPHKYYW